MTFFKRWNNIVGWAVFAIAAAVYLMTMEPVSSLWDCSEFIATSYKLEVGHPPGAPLFMMLARLATLFAFGNPDYVGVAVNAMNSIASAFCILFLFWTITHLARRLVTRGGGELTQANTLAVLGAGIVGALAYTFTDTFWFSAIEGEVYALSSMFTALVVWLMLKWEEEADEPHSSRWIVLIAYMMGLSIGVHILNLLTIPALVFIYYFRKTEKVTFKGMVYATLIAGAILLFINNIIIPYTVYVGAMVDLFFVNTLGLPVNSGIVLFALALILGCGWAAWYTHRKGKVVWNIILLSTTMVLVGFSSYASVTIRAAANPPMNSNNPNNPHALLSMLNRDQYGDRPLLLGAYYSAPPEGYKEKSFYYLDEDGKYKSASVITGYTHSPEFVHFFPRMWDARKGEKEYKQWGAYRTRTDVMRDDKGEILRDEQGRPIRGEVVDFGRKKLYNDGYEDRTIVEPTFAENLNFFFNYQLSYMYWRYFLWNFVGRQSDIQPTRTQITDGNWLSGIKWIDEKFLGPQDDLPREIAENKGRNTYYFLPFLLGLIGLIYQLNRDERNFSIVLWLFIMTGIALVFYFNTSPGEPRERDYVYAGSFYAFSIWIGFGVLAIRDLVAWLTKRKNVTAAVAATAVCMVVHKDLTYPNIGPRDSYLLYHEELESLVKHFPTIKRARFWMTFGQEYLTHLRVIQNIGMARIDEVDYNGVKIVPLQFLKAVLPNPQDLGENYEGETSIGCRIRGLKDGKERTYYVYNNCSHQEAYKETGMQGVSYTTGVPAMIGAMMFFKGEWKRPGVNNVEEFNPDPFMEQLNKQGLPWHEVFDKNLEL